MLRESSGIWKEQQILDSSTGNPYKLVGFCDADYLGDRIERKSTSGTISFLVRIWYPGLAKDNQLLLCLRQKENTSQLQVVVHNYFGWNISWKTIRLMLTVFPFIVIILVLFVCQRIQFYIQGQRILKSNTTLLEIMFKKEF